MNSKYTNNMSFVFLKSSFIFVSKLDHKVIEIFSKLHFDLLYIYIKSIVKKCKAITHTEFDIFDHKSEITKIIRKNLKLSDQS